MPRASYVGHFVLAALIAGAPLRGANAQAVARPDLARTIDAEVRVATFETVAGNELAALSRLERLSALVSRDSAGAAGPEKAGLHFLLSQAYYRLAMLGQFRREAEAALASGQPRYATVLRPQLLIEAYLSGDYPRATTLAREIPAADAGLGALVTGLSLIHI